MLLGCARFFCDSSVSGSARSCVRGRGSGLRVPVCVSVCVSVTPPLVCALSLHPQKAPVFPPLSVGLCRFSSDLSFRSVLFAAAFRQRVKRLRALQATALTTTDAQSAGTHRLEVLVAFSAQHVDLCPTHVEYAAGLVTFCLSLRVLPHLNLPLPAFRFLVVRRLRMPLCNRPSFVLACYRCLCTSPSFFCYRKTKKTCAFCLCIGPDESGRRNAPHCCRCSDQRYRHDSENPLAQKQKECGGTRCLGLLFSHRVFLSSCAHTDMDVGSDFHLMSPALCFSGVSNTHFLLDVASRCRCRLLHGTTRGGHSRCFPPPSSAPTSGYLPQRAICCSPLATLAFVLFSRGVLCLCLCLCALWI